MITSRVFYLRSVCSSVSSSGPVLITAADQLAGLSIENQSERDQVLEMLSERQQRCGWPTRSLGEELQDKWKTMDQARA